MDSNAFSGGTGGQNEPKRGLRKSSRRGFWRGIFGPKSEDFIKQVHFSLEKGKMRVPRGLKLIKSDVISEDDGGPEAKGALGRQNEDLDEASRATAGAPSPEGGPTRPQSAATRTFVFARGEAEEN